MKVLAIATCALGAVASARHCHPDPHLVTNLPDVRSRAFEETFCQYAGYIPVSKSKRLFYWMTEAQHDPENAPLVLWLNGGPGCSSLGGFLSELGPFRPSKGGKSLLEYPHSWNRIANVLFLESPAGVGFSDSTDETDYTTGDGQTTKDAHIFLFKFLERYPRYQGRSFWITGESYAGHYVPLLAQSIVRGDLHGLKPAINIKGYLLGNPTTDYMYDGYGEAFMWFSHNLISDSTYAGLMRYCGYADVARAVALQQSKELLGRERNIRGLRLGSEMSASPVELDDATEYPHKCKEYNAKAKEEMSKLVNIYDIYVDVCRQHPWDASHYLHELGKTKHPHAHWAKYMGKKLKDEKYHPCLDNYLPEYLNRRDVRDALHVDPTAQPWKQCADNVQYSHEDHMASMMPVHREMVDAGLQVLIFSGDVDAVLPAAGTRFWLNALGFRKVGPWRHWTVNGQAAGYVQKYEKGLTYATVRNGGHMVPETQPERGYALFTRFISEGHLFDESDIDEIVNPPEPSPTPAYL